MKNFKKNKKSKLLLSALCVLVLVAAVIVTVLNLESQTTVQAAVLHNPPHTTK